ncbi:MAG: hypothetical protein Q7S23_03680 [bacterium]|nr:hypothetical protein [bacterium]
MSKSDVRHQIAGSLAGLRPGYWCAMVVVITLALRVALAVAMPYDAGPDERYRYAVMGELYRTNRVPPYAGNGASHFVVKPVLGYRLNAWVAHAVPGALPLYVKLRFGSALVATLAVVLAYFAVRNLWPEFPARAGIVAALVGFHPKVLGLGMYLNADAYTLLAATLVFYLLTIVHRQGRFSQQLAIAVGLALGLVFLGRENGYAGFVLAAGYGLWLLRERENRWPLAAAVAVALAFPTIFYLQQMLSWGRAYVPFVVGSGISWIPPEYSVVEAYRLPLGSSGFEWPVVHLGWWQPLHWLVFFVPLFTSSFVTFSYHLVDFPALWYSFFFLFATVSVVGWVHRARMVSPARSRSGLSRRWLLGSAAAAVLAQIGAVAWLNFSVLHQPDGRYLLPLAVPALLLLLLGWQFAVRRSSLVRFVTFSAVAFFFMSSIYAAVTLLQSYA